MEDFGWIRAALAVCLVRVGLPAHFHFFEVFEGFWRYRKSILYIRESPIRKNLIFKNQLFFKKKFEHPQKMVGKKFIDRKVTKVLSLDKKNQGAVKVEDKILDRVIFFNF
jgi:hypothetical protein